MASEKKIAIITGAASGMGLAVAQLLAKQSDIWILHLLDFNETAGNNVAKDLSATFHKVDIRNYRQLSSTFHRIWLKEQRLDFVFANAGIFERGNFWETHHGDGPPPEHDWSMVEVNLKGTMNTCYLAKHYFGLDGRKDGVLVVTGSCTALYPSEQTPRYSAVKAALLNFVQGIAPGLLKDYGVRASIILPGAVFTNLVAKEEWPDYPPEWFTSMGVVTSTVGALANGEESLEDAWGSKVEPGQDSGLLIELGVGKIYFRKGFEFCDDTMRKVMGKVAAGEKSSFSFSETHTKL